MVAVPECFFVCLQPIIAAVADPFYKIASEALLVTQQLVKVIRPLGGHMTSFLFFQEQVHILSMLFALNIYAIESVKLM